MPGRRKRVAVTSPASSQRVERFSAGGAAATALTPYWEQLRKDAGAKLLLTTILRNCCILISALYFSTPRHLFDNFSY